MHRKGITQNQNGGTRWQQCHYQSSADNKIYFELSDFVFAGTQGLWKAGDFICPIQKSIKNILLDYSVNLTTAGYSLRFYTENYQGIYPSITLISDRVYYTPRNMNFVTNSDKLYIISESRDYITSEYTYTLTRTDKGFTFITDLSGKVTLFTIEYRYEIIPADGLVEVHYTKILKSIN